MERLVAMRAHRRRRPRRPVFVPPTAMRSTGTSARRSTMSGPQSRSDQLHATRRMDRMVSLVGLQSNLRPGRQNTPPRVRKSGTGFRGSAVRRPGSRRNLLSEQSTLSGQKRPASRRPMVRLGRMERMHVVLRRRIQISSEALRQSSAAARRRRMFRLRSRVPNLQRPFLFRSEKSHHLDTLAVGQRYRPRSNRTPFPVLVQSAHRHQFTQSRTDET